MAHKNELNEAQKISFKNTLNLPQTDFPIRSNAAIEDLLIIERWNQEKLYEKAFEVNNGNQKYILHDGPPYANGNIHLGTAYNKILKDVIAKSHRMAGFHVPVTPGWDCHGLPIELKVTTEFPGLTPEQLKTKCREYAQKWIEVQKEDFKRLGVVMNWNHHYMTMSKKYESDIVRAFGVFIERGYIERSNKTVPWCASCQTVLANAEIEYHERKDPSIYIAFALDKATQKNAFATIEKQINFLIWTTTPWTLPLNKMVILKAKTVYEVLEINDQLLLVGKDLSDKVCQKLSVPKKVVAHCMAEDLLGGNALHPFIDGQLSKIVAGDFVSTEDGTACVHGAPGCGQDDYAVGLQNNIEIFSPISSDGKYEEGILPQILVGQKVTDVLGTIITLLQDNNRLILKESIKHSYPHCWRCRNGLIFRATKQWFCDLSHNDLRQKALDAIETIEFIPAATRNRLKASVSGRLEWCLSRQRVWGVPIVAALCKACNVAFTDLQLIEKVAQGISQAGIEYWDSVDLQTLLPKDAACQSCQSTEFEKEKDILDVWFESGVSHYSVLKNNEELAYPADIYLEGSDQHRAWFQSSLLTSLVLENAPCFKTIATHGYTVDAKGHKMSKSLGNVTAPQEIIEQMGTDGLRLWATSIDLSSDAVVSKILLDNVKEVLRKVRNTCRFLVSNLYDFDIKKDALPVEKLLLFDQYALQELALFNQQVKKAYRNNDLTAVQHLFADYCSGQLSSFYLDIIKDRLYTQKADGRDRRSAQTVCWSILDALTKLMAPIMSFTAEQLSDCYQKNKTTSIHLQQFADVPLVWQGSEKKEKECMWQALQKVRISVLKSLETLRQNGIIKHSLEAKVILAMNKAHEQNKPLLDLLNSVQASGQTQEQFSKEYFIISACEIIDTDTIDDQELEQFTDCLESDSVLLVKAGHADGIKCPRCWQWEVTDQEHGLCSRCQATITVQ